MANDLTAPIEATRVDPKLLEILVCPLTKGTWIRLGEAGIDQPLGEARLSDPRRHSDHAAEEARPLHDDL